jgi:hypothetical protein
MKNIFLSILLLLSTSLFGQYTTTKVQTSTISTSTMIYNYQESKWDFVSNNDATRFETVWTFNVSDNNTGMISNGDVNYDILSYTNVDGLGLIKAFNTKVRRNMDILIKKMDDGGLGIVVFDTEKRISYYFFP